MPRAGRRSAGASCSRARHPLPRRQGRRRARRQPRGGRARRALRGVRASARATSIVLAHTRTTRPRRCSLQLLRGAGVKGLAGMPRRAMRMEACGRGHAGAGHCPDPAAAARCRRAPKSSAMRKRRELDVGRGREQRRHALHAQLAAARGAAALARRVPGVPRARSRARRAHLAEAAALLDELARIDAGAGARNRLRRSSASCVRSRRRARRTCCAFSSLAAAWRMPRRERLDEALRQALERAPRCAPCASIWAGASCAGIAAALHLVAELGRRADGCRRAVARRATLDAARAGACSRWRRTRATGVSVARLADAAGDDPAARGRRAAAARPRPAAAHGEEPAAGSARPALGARAAAAHLLRRAISSACPASAIDCGFAAARGEPAIVPRMARRQPDGIASYVASHARVMSLQRRPTAPT